MSIVAQTLADFDANISNLALTQRDQDFCDLTLDIEVRDVQHVEQLVDALKGSSVVSAASRQLTGEVHFPEINKMKHETVLKNLEGRCFA